MDQYTDKLFFFVSFANLPSTLNQQLEWKPSPKVVRPGLELGLIVHSWRLAPGHSLRKRYFGPALTTLVLVLGLGLGFHASC